MVSLYTATAPSGLFQFVYLSHCKDLDFHDKMVETYWLHCGNPILVRGHLCIETGPCELTHPPLVPHICISESGQHWFRWWLVAYSAPSHYLNQRWVMDNWTIRNKLQWNFNQNTKFFVHKSASENIVCEWAAFLSWGRWVNSLWPSDPSNGSTWVIDDIIIIYNNGPLYGCNWIFFIKLQLETITISSYGSHFVPAWVDTKILYS